MRQYSERKIYKIKKNDGDSVANIGVRDKQGGVQWLAGLILNHSTRDCMHEYETTVLVGI